MKQDLDCLYPSFLQQGCQTTSTGPSGDLDARQAGPVFPGPLQGDTSPAGGDPCPTCLSSFSGPTSGEAASVAPTATTDQLRACRCSWAHAGDKARAGYTGGEPVAASRVVSRHAVSVNRSVPGAGLGSVGGLSKVDTSNTVPSGEAGSLPQETRVAAGMVSPELVRIRVGGPCEGDKVSCDANGVAVAGANAVVGGVPSLVHYHQSLADQAVLHVDHHAHGTADSPEDKMVVDVGADVERVAPMVLEAPKVDNSNVEAPAAAGDAEQDRGTPGVSGTRDMTSLGVNGEKPREQEGSVEGRESVKEGMRIVVKQETLVKDGRVRSAQWSPPSAQSMMPLYHQGPSGSSDGYAFVEAVPGVSEPEQHVTAGATPVVSAEKSEGALQGGVGDGRVEEMLTDADTISRLSQSLAQVRLGGAMCRCSW